MAESLIEQPGASEWHPATHFALRFFLLYFVVVLAPQVVYLRNRPGVVSSARGHRRTVVDCECVWTSPAIAEQVPTHSAARDNLTRAPVRPVGARWSALDRGRSSHSRLHAWLHTAMRFTLGFAMVGYGLAKVLPGQFGPGVDLLSLTAQTGQLLPQQLLWAFMQASRPYTIFAGVVETAGGVLLFSRRTATLGALLCALAMSNVLMLNLAYNVNVKLYSFQLLLLTLFLLAPDARRIVDMLLLNRPTRPRQIPPLFGRPQLDTAARVAGGVLAAGVVFWCYQTSAALALRKQAARSTPLHGIWERDPAVPVEQDSRPESAWRYIVFPYEDTSSAVTISAFNRTDRYTPTIDRRARTLGIRLAADGTGSGALSLTTISQSLTASCCGGRLALTRRSYGSAGWNRRPFRWSATPGGGSWTMELWRFLRRARARSTCCFLRRDEHDVHGAARDSLRGFISKIIIPPGEGLLQVVGNVGIMLEASGGRDCNGGCGGGI